jgi:predicted DNA-binding protein
MGKMLHIRLSNRIVSKLENFSKAIQRNEAFIMKSAVEKYFQECADYQIALDRLYDAEALQMLK